jgi:endonuclease YncB( thermonuclease family)
VVDGDTLAFGRDKVRLWGIDAPETDQLCGDWAAGREATSTLVAIIGGREVACYRKGQDRYGRMVALCSAGGEDVGAKMVELGMAAAYVKYTTRYVDLEARARATGLGMWRHGCRAPWDWRADHRSTWNRG